MDQKKIILMTKLAVEEKKWIKKDRKITSYFSEDYLYVNNFKTRALVLVMTGIILCAYIFWKLQNGDSLPTTAGQVFVQYVIPYGSIMLAITLVYSLLSSRVYKKKYRQAQQRINEYKKDLRELEELEIAKSKGGTKSEVKRRYSNI